MDDVTTYRVALIVSAALGSGSLLALTRAIRAYIPGVLRIPFNIYVSLSILGGLFMMGVHHLFDRALPIEAQSPFQLLIAFYLGAIAWPGFLIYLLIVARSP